MFGLASAELLAADQAVAKVVAVRGEAMHAQGSGELQPISAGQDLFAPGEIRTGADGRIVVQFLGEGARRHQIIGANQRLRWRLRSTGESGRGSSALSNLLAEDISDEMSNVGGSRANNQGDDASRFEMRRVGASAAHQRILIEAEEDFETGNFMGAHVRLMSVSASEAVLTGEDADRYFRTQIRLSLASGDPMHALSTVDRWLNHGPASAGQRGLALLWRATLAGDLGAWETAHTSAEQALRVDEIQGASRARALVVWGRAAHALGQDHEVQEALRHLNEMGLETMELDDQTAAEYETLRELATP